MLIDYISKKYKEFINKYGYFPAVFNPFNLKETTEYCPTLLTGCGSATNRNGIIVCENLLNIKNDYKYKTNTKLKIKRGGNINKLKVLSLFSGIGAFEKALTNLNIDYELVGFSEIDKYAVTSYCAIHGVDKDKNLGNIETINHNDVSNCDLITHGSPCQSYSVAGKGAGGNKGSGTRSSLMWHTVDIVKKKKPKYVLWENVKGVLNKKHIHNFNQYIEDLKKIGYNNYYKVLNAKQFGIPQNRERIYVISIRKDIDSGNFEFPEPFDSGLRLKDMLEDNVDEKYYINNEKSEKLLKQLNYKQSEKIGIDLTINTPKFKDYANCIKARYDAGISNQKTDGTGVIEPTIPTCGGGNIEPKVHTQYKIRKLTPKECWRLMGFDDEDYWEARKALEETFYNGKDRSNSQMYKMAGNSIVVNVLEGIFNNLLRME